jgi:flagellar hook-length control protein FliK
MNIESANLSSLTPGSVAIEAVSLPLTDGSVVSEGFSGTLVAQMELLKNIKTEELLPLQTPNLAELPDVNSPQDLAGLPPGKIDVQDFAALLGNDLPAAYKIKDEVDHGAALDAVTDTLKYIAMGASAEEKAAGAEQNMKDVIAMAIPAQNNEQNAAATVVPVKQTVKDVIATVLPARQNKTDIVVDAEQNMKDAVAVDVPVQMELDQANDKPDKERAEDDAQITNVEDNSGAEELLAAITLPTLTPAEQRTQVNNLTPVDAGEEADLLSFITPSTGDAKPNQPAKNSGDVLQSKTVLRQPDQDKQSFSLKYLDDSRQTDKPGRVERQGSSLEGEKSVPRAGAATLLNKPVVDNKTEVPAMTKPLSHPEWNKDLGDRIVWMSNKAIPTAEIRLNPQHLGPISVRVNVADDQATVVFTAQHAAVRETLEASIPKLREMMSAQNLNLAEVSVSQSPSSDHGRSQSQNFAQSFADGQRQGATGAAGTVDGVEDVEQEIESGRAVVSNGVLSLYA